jgi:uncharacterized protein (UPF0332 family)
MKFESFIKIGKVKKKTPDPQEGQALLSQAKDRLDYVKDKEITTKSAKFVFEDAYEAVREAAQGLMSIKGYKPYSHEATISFVAKFHENDFSKEDISNFDYYRVLRNDSVYRAVQILPQDAKDSLEFARKFVIKASKVFQ